MRKYHKDGSQPKPDEIFVFGSNLSGIHGAGAAKQAITYGAQYGVGVGFMGNTYAIPTKDFKVDTLPLTNIAFFVKLFTQASLNTPNMQYFVTAVGTGLAGYSHEQIAPLFADCGDNCSFPHVWEKYLN